MKFLFFLFFPLLLYCDTTYIMELEKILSNDTYLFRYRQDRIVCNVYGIIPIEAILRDTRLNRVCHEKLVQFFLKNPKMLYYAHYRLHERSFYHVELKEGKCLVFLDSPRSFSQELIKEGLALYDPFLHDKIYGFLFLQAEKIAKRLSRGVWQESQLKACLANYIKIKR